MSQYYYILNSRPNKPKMKPVKPIHEPSFKCTFVTAEPAKEKVAEEVVKQPKKRTRKKVEEPVVVEEVVQKEPVVEEPIQAPVVEEQSEPSI